MSLHDVDLPSDVVSPLALLRVFEWLEDSFIGSYAGSVPSLWPICGIFLIGDNCAGVVPYKGLCSLFSAPSL